MLPRTFEEIARQATDFQRRIESLEHQRSGSNRLIDSAILTAPVASVVFSNIPNIYDHLLILCYARSDRVALNDVLVMRYNADAGNNYDWFELVFSIFGSAGFDAVATDRIYVGIIEATNAAANTFSLDLVRINSYANIINHKTCVGDSTLKNANVVGNLFRIYTAGWWRNIVPITSITLFSNTGSNLIAGSRFDLYGIQGG